MAISHQLSFQNFRNTAGTTLTATVTPGAVGDLVCIGCLNNNIATMTVADDLLNQWYTANPIFSNVSDRGQSFYCFARTTALMTITLTMSGSVTFATILGDTFRGTDRTPSGVLGTINSAISASSTNPISGTLILDADDCAIWSWTADSITGVGNIDGSVATAGADDTQQDWSEWRVLAGRKGVGITAAFVGALGPYSIGTVAWRPPQNMFVDRKVRPFPFKPGSPPSRNSPFR